MMTIPNLSERRHFDTLNTLKTVQILLSRSFEKLSFMHGSTVEHFKVESCNFDSINDIFKGTNSMTTIPNLGERRHFDTLYTLKKVQILISGSFEFLSFSHESILEHFEQERDDFDSIDHISKYTNLMMMIPNLGKRRHFDTLYTLKKVQILILGSFEILCFSHESILEHFEQESDGFDSIDDISKYTNLMMMISNLGERRHFDTLNTLKAVKTLLSGSFEKLSFMHGSRVQHFDSINDIFKGTNSMTTIPNLGERLHFDTLYTLKKAKF